MSTTVVNLPLPIGLTLPVSREERELDSASERLSTARRTYNRSMTRWGHALDHGDMEEAAEQLDDATKELEAAEAHHFNANRRYRARRH